ncbi:uncharacterized protein [Pyxicephalus adspersus]|uniref:uncharacterized protein n=1 Tax=Pyxicephalus adspersus TaxID=30357 RepID=UPI003B59025B
MVEPCENQGTPDSSTPELNPLGSYQWKGRNRSVWNKFQDWRTSFIQHNSSTKKQLRLFKKSKSSGESKTGSFARYLGSVSLPQKRRGKDVTEPDKVIEETPVISSLSPTPEVPVWDVSNFSLVDGRLVRTKGEEQDAFHTRSRAGSCVSSTEAVLGDRAETDPNADGNADFESKNQFNNVKIIIYRFGEKEDYMLFMNGFLEQYWDGMSLFLQTVTDLDSEVAPAGYEGSIDLAYELATLHFLLCGIFKGVHQQTKDQMEPLATILKALAEGLPVPECITQDQSQEESEEPEYMFPKDMRNFRPLVKKCQSLSSLMREQMVPLPRIEEREKKSRRHVTRTQSVPAQSRPGRERRTRADTNSVAENIKEDTANVVKRTPRLRPSSTLPRRKSTVPWCRNEDLHLTRPKNEIVENEERHLEEMREQIAENLGKQKDLEGQLLIMTEKMQEVMSQLAKMEEMYQTSRAEMAEQMSKMQDRINILEKNSAEKSQKEKNEEEISVLENHVSSFKKNCWKKNENPSITHKKQDDKTENNCEDTAIEQDCVMTNNSDTA